MAGGTAVSGDCAMASSAVANKHVGIGSECDCGSKGFAEKPAACEGHQEERDGEKLPCSRPGCYELFPPNRRSPLKKFCSALCCQALRRVHQREAHWQKRHALVFNEVGRDRFHGPPDWSG